MIYCKDCKKFAKVKAVWVSGGGHVRIAGSCKHCGYDEKTDYPKGTPIDEIPHSKVDYDDFEELGFQEDFKNNNPPILMTSIKTIEDILTRFEPMAKSCFACTLNKCDAHKYNAGHRLQWLRKEMTALLKSHNETLAAMIEKNGHNPDVDVEEYTDNMGSYDDMFDFAVCKQRQFDADLIRSHPIQ